MRKSLLLLTMGIIMCTQITRADDNLFFEFQPGFSHQINNVWKLSASEKLYYTGSGRFLGHATNVGLAYSGLTDWLTLSMNFKYAEKNSTGDSWIREYRPHFNVTVNDKIGEMPWSNRTRIEYRDFDEKKDRWRLRNKLILDMPFEIPVLNATPYIGDEVLFNLSENGYYQNRLYTGLKFKIAEDLKANLYYYWRKAKKSSGWDEASIIGANLTLKF